MRTKKYDNREAQKDPKYKSKAVAKLINQVMERGKKKVAQRHVYNALEKASKELKQDELEVLDSALDNIKPKVEVRSRRVGGAAYQVPMPVKPNRQFSLSIRWLVLSAKNRSNKQHKTFADKLAAELIAAYKSEGGAVKKKIDTHKMAEANKAFAHFRW